MLILALLFHAFYLQDVLFGRGGLTNRHIGNLRYRDIISIHRQDYVSAQKTDKPSVARKIVKAIRTGDKPGRFLRKGDDDKWHEVSDKEAAWKASQALREKTRWSSMKKVDESNNNDDDNADERKQPALASSPTKQSDPLAASTVQKIDSATKAKRKKSQSSSDGAFIDESMATSPRVKRGKTEEGGSATKKQSSESAAADSGLQVVATMPTAVSQITVPPVENLGGSRKMGSAASYMLPSMIATGDDSTFPTDEDVLFGRGGRTNHHPGNKRLREIVNRYRHVYTQARKVDKPKLSKLIVNALRGANCRFLKMNEQTSRWEDVGDKRACEKVSQTLREKDRDENEKVESAESVQTSSHQTFVSSQQQQQEENQKQQEEIQMAAHAMVGLPSPLNMKEESVEV